MNDIVEDIAFRFSAALMLAIGPKTLREVVTRNKNETVSGVCHSHDFVDANECMAEAFIKVMGRGIRLPCEVDEGLHTQADTDADFALIDKAWSLAADNGFYLTESLPSPDAFAESGHVFGRRDIQVFLLERGTREQLIEWLVWNDGNGVYTDEDSIAEGYTPLTLETARATMNEILKRETGGVDS